MVYMMIDSLLKKEYKLGEPWKLPKAAGFLVPLLLLAAFVEANVTPQIVMWAYGG